MKHDVFTIRLSADERRRILALRGAFESAEGVRISLADVVRRGLECLEAHQKKSPVVRDGA